MIRVDENEVQIVRKQTSMKKNAALYNTRKSLPKYKCVDVLLDNGKNDTWLVPTGNIIRVSRNQLDAYAEVEEGDFPMESIDDTCFFQEFQSSLTSNETQEIHNPCRVSAQSIDFGFNSQQRRGRSEAEQSSHEGIAHSLPMSLDGAQPSATSKDLRGDEGMNDRFVLRIDGFHSIHIELVNSSEKNDTLPVPRGSSTKTLSFADPSKDNANAYHSPPHDKFLSPPTAAQRPPSISHSIPTPPKPQYISLQYHNMMDIYDIKKYLLLEFPNDALHMVGKVSSPSSNESSDSLFNLFSKKLRSLFVSSPSSHPSSINSLPSNPFGNGHGGSAGAYANTFKIPTCTVFFWNNFHLLYQKRMESVRNVLCNDSSATEIQGFLHSVIDLNQPRATSPYRKHHPSSPPKKYPRGKGINKDPLSNHEIEEGIRQEKVGGIELEKRAMMHDIGDMDDALDIYTKVIPLDNTWKLPCKSYKSQFQCSDHTLYEEAIENDFCLDDTDEKCLPHIVHSKKMNPSGPTSSSLLLKKSKGRNSLSNSLISADPLAFGREHTLSSSAGENSLRVSNSSSHEVFLNNRALEESPPGILGARGSEGSTKIPSSTQSGQVSPNPNSKGFSLESPLPLHLPPSYKLTPLQNTVSEHRKEKGKPIVSSEKRGEIDETRKSRDIHSRTTNKLERSPSNEAKLDELMKSIVCKAHDMPLDNFIDEKLRELFDKKKEVLRRQGEPRDDNMTERGDRETRGVNLCCDSDASDAGDLHRAKKISYPTVLVASLSSNRLRKVLAGIKYQSSSSNSSSSSSPSTPNAFASVPVNSLPTINESPSQGENRRYKVIFVLDTSYQEHQQVARILSS